MNPNTIGDIGLFLCGIIAGAAGCVLRYEIRDARRLNRLLRDVRHPRRVCAWCQCDLGPTEAEGTSHGMCDRCSAKLLHDELE